MDVGTWLRGLGMERYAQAFLDNAIDTDILASLTAEDLKDLGVTLVGHRRRLLEAISALGRSPSVDAPPQRITQAEAERRQVTVLFADLSGFTSLSRELDPEELHGVLSRYFERLDQIVVQHGGSVDKHVGDCVMGVFGAPLAHGNDAERAVRAALAIRDAMPAVSAAVGRDLAGHIGIAGGEVVASATGSESHREYTVTGETVNLASRLTSAAQPREILISDAIRHALADRLDYAERGTLSVKGFAEPVRAWSVLGFLGQAKARDFVGRQSELQQFRALLAACATSGHGQLIVVRGEPGIGKTRLVGEFQQAARDAGFACHVGLILDFGTRTGRDAVRSLVRSLVGLEAESDEPSSTAAADLATSDGLAVPADTVFLNDLIDAPQLPEQRALYDAMDHATRLAGRRRVLAHLLERASRVQPRLLIVEDLHWADRPTLADLAAIASTAAERSMILVMTTRIEGDPLDHAWRMETAGVPLSTIDLGPLLAAEARQLATPWIATADDLVQRCIERAAGNPLFLEQLLHHAGQAAEARVPGSVRSLVQARLDRLSPDDKAAIQAASVLGQVLEPDAVAHLLDATGAPLDRLVSHLLLRPKGNGFMFHHALIRDAIYDGLLKSRRRELHRRAAAWYVGRDAVLRAEHLDRAGDAEAARAYQEAAAAQLTSFHYEAARRLVERGLVLAATPSEHCDLETLRGDILYDLGDMPVARNAFDSALATAANDEQQCRAWIGLATVKRMVDDLDGALADLDCAAERATGLLREQARIHYLRGNLCFPRGDVEGCIREHSKSLELARKAGMAELEAAALGGIGDGQYMRGRMMSAHEAFGRCLELCGQHGFGRIEVANRPMHAATAWFVGETRAALEKARASIAAAQRVGHQRAQMIGHHTAIFCLYEQMEWAEAWRHIEPALKLAQQLGATRFVAEAVALRAQLHFIDGERTTALADIEQALTICRETGMLYLGAFIFGILARITDDPLVFEAALAEGNALLAAGAVSHNHYLFHRDAIDACLDRGLWDRAEQHAAALEAYTAPEPSPWGSFLGARARALAAVGRGDHSEVIKAELSRLRLIGEGERLGFMRSIEAMASCTP